MSTKGAGKNIVDDPIFDEVAHLICDSHIHIGRFEDGKYFSPEDICNKLKTLGIKKWAVSSLSTIDNDFSIVEKEMNALMDMAPDQTIPLLWVTPRMLNESCDLRKYDTIHFAGIKIHGFADSWNPSGDPLKTVFGIALNDGLPILLHTGGKPEADAIAYDKICSQFKELTVILAHGRPIEQAVRVMNNNPNAYVDIAFMPVEHIIKLRQYVDDERILFGTDFPVDEHYYQKDSSIVRYKERVNSLVELFGKEVFLTWADKNFHNVFSMGIENAQR